MTTIYARIVEGEKEEYAIIAQGLWSDELLKKLDKFSEQETVNIEDVQDFLANNDFTPVGLTMFYKIIK